MEYAIPHIQDPHFGFPLRGGRSLAFLGVILPVTYLPTACRQIEVW